MLTLRVSSRYRISPVTAIQIFSKEEIPMLMNISISLMASTVWSR